MLPLHLYLNIFDTRDVRNTEVDVGKLAGSNETISHSSHKKKTTNKQISYLQVCQLFSRRLQDRRATFQAITRLAMSLSKFDCSR